SSTSRRSSDPAASPTSRRQTSSRSPRPAPTAPTTRGTSRSTRPASSARCARRTSATCSSSASSMRASCARTSSRSSTPAGTPSLTPVLCAQLQAPGVTGRFAAFVRRVRRASHRLDAEAARRAGDEDVARAIEQSAALYETALERFERLGGDLLGALAPYATWTSAATHAVLPLLATDAGVRLQVRGGIESHRRRTGTWAGGFWLPECAHASELDPLLAGEGV